MCASLIYSFSFIYLLLIKVVGIYFLEIVMHMWAFFLRSVPRLLLITAEFHWPQHTAHLFSLCLTYCKWGCTWVPPVWGASYFRVPAVIFEYLHEIYRARCPTPWKVLKPEAFWYHGRDFRSCRMWALHFRSSSEGCSPLGYIVRLNTEMISQELAPYCKESITNVILLSTSAHPYSHSLILTICNPGPTSEFYVRHLCRS